MHQGRSSVMHCLHRRFQDFASYRLRQQPRHDSGRSKPPSWSRRATHRAFAKAIKQYGRTSAVIYRHLSFSQWKIGHFTLLCYIIPSLPHPVSADYFRIRYRGKMVVLILVHVHDLHFNKTYTYPTPNLSYTNTSKLTWNKPLH